MKTQVELCGDGGLACPHCNGLYLHHNTITSYLRRTEDAEESDLIQVDGDVVTLETLGSSANPSPRRSAVGIKFHCEQGCPSSEFIMYQHKGTTYMGWRMI